VKFLKDCGLAALSVNLELYDSDKSKRYMEDKYNIGKDNYLVFISEAVREFGEGAVRSTMIVGLEEKEYTLLGVKALCEIGCLPVLSPFIPDARTKLPHHEKPDPEFLLSTLLEATEITKEYGLNLGPVCLPCRHNVLSMED
jgi:hypothetical protein